MPLTSTEFFSRRHKSKGEYLSEGKHSSDELRQVKEALAEREKEVSTLYLCIDELVKELERASPDYAMHTHQQQKETTTSAKCGVLLQDSANHVDRQQSLETIVDNTARWDYERGSETINTNMWTNVIHKRKQPAKQPCAKKDAGTSRNLNKSKKDSKKAQKEEELPKPAPLIFRDFLGKRK